MYMNEGLGAAGAPVLRTTATGASIGTSILPGIGTAVGAAIGAVVGLAVPKKHYSPWNFLYDEYPTRIYNQEIEIANARNAIAQLSGGPVTPKPPGPPGTSGGPAYQASMQAIVPRYVPGSEQQIASYNRVLNESGGAYERTYGMQQQLMQQLQSQLSSLQTAAAIRGSVPASGSATSPVSLPAQSPAPIAMSPSMVQFPNTTVSPSVPSSYVTPEASPYTPPPSSATDYVPAIRPQAVQAGMLPGFDLQGAAPYIMGGIALLFILMDKKKGH